jgi:uncharacterized protein (DUF1697 family)
MSKRIALFRGINVGGKRKILMADLKALFHELNYIDAATYIQSGNVVFSTDSADKNSEIENRIEEAVAKRYGFDVPIIVKTEKELYQAIDSNPFTHEAAVERLHLSFLQEPPSDENLAQIATYDFAPDAFQVQESNVFVYCSGKYSDSKLTNNFFESKLKKRATTRNWKTVLKLVELLKTS